MVRRVPRGRRLKVRVDPEHGVEVLLPTGLPLRARPRAVAELRPWIDEQLAARSAPARAPAPCRAPCPTSTSSSSLVPQPGRTRTHRRGASCWCPPATGARASIERWYRRAAREEIAARLDRGERGGGRPLRGPRRSATSARAGRAARSGGAMSFNWRLLLAPERVLDYVVWHEVCHLEVADHSPRFWALLESRCPDWREPAAWLPSSARRWWL